LAAAGASWDATKIEDAFKLMLCDAQRDDRYRASMRQGSSVPRKPWESKFRSNKVNYEDEQEVATGEVATGGSKVLVLEDGSPYYDPEYVDEELGDEEEEEDFEEGDDDFEAAQELMDAYDQGVQAMRCLKTMGWKGKGWSTGGGKGKPKSAQKERTLP
jgi:hypothetical protein